MYHCYSHDHKFLLLKIGFPRVHSPKENTKEKDQIREIREKEKGTKNK